MSIPPPKLLLLLLSLWKIVSIARADINAKYISTASDLIEFSSLVNSGGITLTSGSVVYLENDIVFSPGENFEPIGRNSTYNLKGVFDGQGHTISNLVVNVSSTPYAGLFGYSSGTAIQNVVLDESCTVTSSYSDESEDAEASTGGIVGYFRTYDLFSITGVVNMATVVFSGDVGKYSYLGGISGCISGSFTVKNCANYGAVTFAGTVQNDYAAIGGVAGVLKGGGPNTGIILNSLNYGTISYDNAVLPSKMYIGGIVGYGSGELTTTMNCLSCGRIDTTDLNTGSYVGCLVGYSNSKYVNISYSHWTSDDRNNNSTVGDNTDAIVGFGMGYFANLGTKSLEKLNDIAERYSDSGWSVWRILYLNGGSVNGVERATLIATGEHFPRPAKDGNSFLFWSSDAECTVPYDASGEGGANADAIYAAWHNVTVTFDPNGGTCAVVQSVVAHNRTYGELPSAQMEGHTFVGWYSAQAGGAAVTAQSGLVSRSDHTVYAAYRPNNYTITFNLGDGAESVETFEYNATVTLPVPERDGYIFEHWCCDAALSDECAYARMPAGNVTLYAKWTKVTECVEVVFGKKDLNDTEIEEIISRYARDAEYEISAIERSGDGVRVIVKFKDAEGGKNFAQNLDENPQSYITKISFVDRTNNSNSIFAQNLLFFLTMCI